MCFSVFHTIFIYSAKILYYSNYFERTIEYMKVKASWAAFVPFTVGAVLLHIYHLFFLGGDEITQHLYGGYSLLINKSTEPELIVLLAAVMFVFLVLFNLIDRKTSSYCDIKRSGLSGLFMIISGLLLGVESAVALVTVSPSSESVTSDFAISILGVCVSLVFAIVGMGLLIGFNIAKKMRICMVLPTIWAAVEMIKSFVAHREQAPSLSFFDVFVWVFLTVFLFQNSMVLCGIEIKNPVKSSFTYGFMFILFAIVYTISEIKGSMDELGYFEVTALVPQFLIAALGLYAFVSLANLSSKMITKQKADELYGSLSEEQKGEKSEKKSSKKNDDFDEDTDEPEAAFGVGSTKYVTAEFEKIRLEKATKKAQERTGKLPGMLNSDDDDDEDEEPLSTLDKIDQLIMELSDDANK